MFADSAVGELVLPVVLGEHPLEVVRGMVCCSSTLGLRVGEVLADGNGQRTLSAGVRVIGRAVQRLSVLWLDSRWDALRSSEFVGISRLGALSCVFDIWLSCRTSEFKSGGLP